MSQTKVHREDYEEFWEISILGDGSSRYCQNSTWNHISIYSLKFGWAIGTKLLVQGTGGQLITGRRKKKKGKQKRSKAKKGDQEYMVGPILQLGEMKQHVYKVYPPYPKTQIH